MRSLFRNWKVLAAVLVVLLILVAALWPESVEVDMVMLERGPLQVTIDDEGETRVRERFVVSAPVAGRLERIELEPGDPVRRGQTVLARLTPAAPAFIDARAQAELSAGLQAARAVVGQARAERQRAAATLERVRAQLERQRQLLAAGAIAREEFETTETAARSADEAVKAADFAVTRAEFDQQMAGARLQPAGSGSSSRVIAITSPIDGVVLKRAHESEAVVQAGEPLIEIGNPGQLEIVADLLSTDAVRVKPGAKVLIEQWGGPQPLEGRVRRVDPSGFMKVSALGVEEQRVNVVIDFTDPASARALGDGYRVEVRIVSWEAADVIRVPTGALFRSGTEWAVFTVENGRARTRRLTIGQRNASHAQILEGLDAGTPVVMHPPDTLRDDVQVTPRPAS